MPHICLHDRPTIETVLRRSPYLNLYGIGDLDEFFWPQTTWYGWQEGQAVEAVALLYSGLELPCLLALCDEADTEAMRSLLRSIAHLLPVRVYCHLIKPLETVLAQHYRLDSHGVHFKMGLLDRSRLEEDCGTRRSGTIQGGAGQVGTIQGGTGVSPVIVPLTSADTDQMLQLYAAAYPGHWFEPHMLATGQYLGLRADGRLVAIAGVHVHSRRYRVATLGNITTHPDHRGRGHATVLTAALCRQLLASCDHIGLNVKADNIAAIRCYEKLGFAVVGEYEEFMATRRDQVTVPGEGMIASFEGKTPEIGDETYIHPSADVFGNVQVGRGCWIGPGARIRGDYGRIVIGDHTAVEDNVVIHARPDEQTTIGDWVTLGHACIVHNATIHDWAVVGMGAIVSDWSDVGTWAVVGEGAVVRQNQQIAAGRIAVGVPAKVLDKVVTDEYKAEWKHWKEVYVDLARRYPEGLRP